jgi:HEAT repeat protein
VRELLADRDPLVRAAALAALGSVGCDDSDIDAVQRALAETAWQVRQGAVRALAGASPEAAVAPLTQALTVPHLDVRKESVLALTRWAASESAARDALAGAARRPRRRCACLCKARTGGHWRSTDNAPI